MIRAQNKSVLFHFVWARRYLDNLEEYSGMDEATSEDLASPSRSLRESDGVGPEDCMRKLRTVDSENSQLLPQRNQYFYFAKAFGWKKPFEGGAGMVPHRRGEESEA